MSTDKSIMGWRILESLLPTLISAVIAAPTAAWIARGSIDALDKRVGVVESNVSDLRMNNVPRKEHEAHWQATEDALRRIETDLREMRREQQRKSP